MYLLKFAEAGKQKTKHLENMTGYTTKLAPLAIVILLLKGQGLLAQDGKETELNNEVTSLDLSNLHLKEVPTEIGKLNKLKVLNLSGNDFKSLPAILLKLHDLEEIYLNDDPCLDIRQAISVLEKLPYLKILHLDNHAGLQVPSSIRSLRHLRYLTLRNDGLKQIPESVVHMKRLRYLDVRGNLIDREKLFPNFHSRMKMVLTDHFIIKHHLLSGWHLYPDNRFSTGTAGSFGQFQKHDNRTKKTNVFSKTIDWPARTIMAQPDGPVGSINLRLSDIKLNQQTTKSNLFGVKF